MTYNMRFKTGLFGFLLFASTICVGQSNNIPEVKVSAVCKKQENSKIKSSFLHQIAALGDKREFYQAVKNGLAIDAIDQVGRTPLHILSRTGNLKMLSELIRFANTSGKDHDFVKLCVTQSYALFLPSYDEVVKARTVLFDYLRTFQGKLKFPPYVALEILKLDSTVHEILATVFLSELEVGNPSSSLILANTKHILVAKLFDRARAFFLDALEDAECAKRMQVMGSFLKDQPAFKSWKAVMKEERLDETWLDKNLADLILTGIEDRFNQLNNRV